MNALQVFKSDEFGKVRILIIDGEPWFVGIDVANILKYSNTRDALANHVDEEDKNTVAIHDGIRGNPNRVVINESGVYSLIFGSTLPSAKKFKRWVTSVVLPTIRKNGSYAVTDWTAARLSGKATRLQETDVLKQLVEYAREQGSKHADMLYMVYTKLVKGYIPNARDELTVHELEMIKLMENIIIQTIRRGMVDEKHYKEIYKDCQYRLDQFTDIGYLDTIFSLPKKRTKRLTTKAG